MSSAFALRIWYSIVYGHHSATVIMVAMIPGGGGTAEIFRDFRTLPQRELKNSLNGYKKYPP